MTEMTTPATPAADAVSLDDLAGQLLECIDDTPWLTCNVAKAVVRTAAEELHMATARESALVAERDAYKAMVEDVSTEVHLLRAALVYIAEESDDMVALKCAQAALAAPAVEG